MVQRTLKPDTRPKVKESLRVIVDGFNQIVGEIKGNFPRTRDFGGNVFPLGRSGDQVYYSTTRGNFIMANYTAADGKKYEIRVSEVNEGVSGRDLPGIQ